MAEISPESSTNPDLGSFLLLVAVVALLACTVYLIYLGCSYFGAGTFFRAIYSPQRVPQIVAWILPCG